MVIPTTFISGLSVSFPVSFSQYPASEWDATLYLRSANHAADIIAQKQENSFLFAADGMTTAEWLPGEYTAVIRVTKGQDVYQPYSERVTVLPDLVRLDTHDPRSDAEKALQAIRNTLANRATADQLKLSFGGRSLEKTPISDLLKLERRFAVMVAKEKRAKSGRGLLKITKVRMR
ncbi:MULTISPECIES: hypothetical protein [Vibrio]|uniref:hypothetical protein n=1 Tax=Vibrio TaxID=662 RepID=UPI001302ABBD|nr:MULTISPECIES: hypothetical protein [Vibrio]EJL6616038.1 hypothetical protein [Vibrio cholerae]EJL6649084.1 hypothetical protein [Vibrio cholerae]MDV2341707.1 hypothetical protein [Vibrio cholerae]HDZ3692816.1 hypothetical protein [Vibrio cholerae]